MVQTNSVLSVLLIWAFHCLVSVRNIVGVKCDKVVDFQNLVTKVMLVKCDVYPIGKWVDSLFLDNQRKFKHTLHYS